MDRSLPSVEEEAEHFLSFFTRLHYAYSYRRLSLEFIVRVSGVSVRTARARQVRGVQRHRVLYTLRVHTVYCAALAATRQEGLVGLSFVWSACCVFRLSIKLETLSSFAC